MMNCSPTVNYSNNTLQPCCCSLKPSISNIGQQAQSCVSCTSSKKGLLSSSAANVEALVAAALHEVRVEERDEALHDVHGVAETLEENKLEIAQKVGEMEKQLTMIESKGAYEKAQILSSEYVSDKKLRLAFLRSERLDPVKAAQRMVRHFEWKLALFGEDKLVREIRWSDFDTEELELFRSSSFQMKPDREDCVGRPIICMARSVTPTTKEMRAMQRLYWYRAMRVVAEHEESQTRGVVGVWYYYSSPFAGSHPTPPGDATGAPSSCEVSHASETIELTGAVPLRHAAIHFCYRDTAVDPFLRLVAERMENSLRIRVKHHNGSHQEVQHALMTYGIPRSAVPLTWWDERTTTSPSDHKKSSSSGAPKPTKNKKDSSSSGEEDATKVTGISATPRPADVLLGRGKMVEGSPGNKLFRRMIEESRSRYDEAPWFDKVVVAQYVLSQVKESGGRFLKRSEEGAGWVEVDDCTARQKVSHSFRNHRNRPNKDRRGVLVSSQHRHGGHRQVVYMPGFSTANVVAG